MHFKDHFSDQSDRYRQFRPDYPSTLYAHILAQAGERQLAWDCATGNGQAAIRLAEYFRHVVASDASATQVQQAITADRVEYRVMPAEHSDLEDASVDLISVAQALHWFDIPAFFREAQRVLKPGGILAAWCYQRLRIDPDIDAIIEHFYGETLGDYWPDERSRVENAYDDIVFPFPSHQVSRFIMDAEWTLTRLLGYLDTWSATRALARATGEDPVAMLAAPLRQHWGDDSQLRRVSWPITLHLCRNNN